MPVDLMVMQRSCSSWRVSVRRASPAFSWAMIPAAATRESVRVDLPCYVEREIGRGTGRGRGESLGSSAESG
jgi:hypothetical protein